VSVEIRPYQPDDLAELKRITVEAFEGLALDERIEEQIGVVHKRDWRWRKARDVEDEVLGDVGTLLLRGGVETQPPEDLCRHGASCPARSQPILVSVNAGRNRTG